MSLAKMPEKVIFTGDIFRPATLGFRPSQTGNIRWLHALLRGPLARATGLATHQVVWNEICDIAGFYDREGCPHNNDGWARIFDLPAFCPRNETILAEWFSDSLVVGFEMPPSLRAALDRMGCAFLNFGIHPVRFLDDIYFGVSSNCATLFEAIRSYALIEKTIWRQAELLQAGYAKRAPFSGEPHSLLFLDQLAIDGALIREGRFAKIANYADALSKLTAGVERVIYKPHPYGSPADGAEQLGIPTERLVLRKDNLYRLLSADWLKSVVSLSSSGSLEAAYFGKAGHHLCPPRTCYAPPDACYAPETSLGIYEGFLDEDFWRNVISAFGPASRRDDERFCRPPNTLRISLGDFWGFNEVSTDCFVTLCKSPLEQKIADLKAELLPLRWQAFTLLTPDGMPQPLRLAGNDFGRLALEGGWRQGLAGTPAWTTTTGRLRLPKSSRWGELAGLKVEVYLDLPPPASRIEPPAPLSIILNGRPVSLAWPGSYRGLRKGYAYFWFRFPADMERQGDLEMDITPDFFRASGSVEVNDSAGPFLGLWLSTLYPILDKH